MTKDEYEAVYSKVFGADVDENDVAILINIARLQGHQQGMEMAAAKVLESASMFFGQRKDEQARLLREQATEISLKAQQMQIFDL